MAYGLFLYKEFVSKSNKTIRLEIFQKDYAGISAEIESMGNNPLVLVSDNANSSVYLPIVKSYLDISIVDTNQVDYSVFFTPDATKFKVIVKVNGTPEWSGYLTPDSFEQDLRFRGDISLTARDNLGMLSEFDYDLTNSFYSITTLIDTALTKIGFQFTLEYRINKVDSLDETIRNGLTQSKFWIGKTWQEVLETILTGMGCQMRYVGDNKFAIYDIGYLSSLGTPHTPQTFSFIEQGGNQEIIPAWKVLTINQDYGLGDNIYDGFVEQSNYDFYAYRGGDVDNPYNFYLRPFYTIPLSSDWVSTIPMLSPYEYPNIDPNNLYITGKSPETTLFMSSKLIYGKYFEAVSDGKAIQFKFKANNYPHYITQRRSGEYMVGAMLRARYLYTMKVRCNLFAQTATEKYVLQGQNWIPWTTDYNDSLEFSLPQTKESSVYGKQGTELTSQMDSPQDQDITIEAYGLGESANVWIEFYPYTATYTEVDGLGAVDDYPAIVFDVHTMKLSGFELRIVENEIGGLESKVTINANHNINGAVDLSLGEVPSGLGGYHTYLAGIFKNSHPYYPPMTGFHFAGGTNYKLSELIGREVAHHYKTQKNKLSGTIINSLNFAAMPSFGKTFTDGVKNYALNYGALDFRNETMQVELIEVDPYETEDYTFIEATIDTGGTSLGSGETEFIQWSAAGNAKRIYDLDTASESDQGGAFVFIDKSGLTAAKKVPISSLLVDAYTKTESDSRFASIDGDLTQDFSAKKLTTATLLLPQSAPTLDSGEVGIYSLDSGFSGEMPSGSGSVTSIALTMPTGFSVSGSPITESGTFGVTFASGYFLPTTTQFASKADVSLIGAANGIAPLDSGGKVALQYLPSTLLKYMGVWNASTNTPTLLATDVNRKGQVWNVSVAGTQFGVAFKLGDWLIYNDSGVAEKSDNSDDVTSVNGYTGAVTLKTSDIAEQTNLYYTDARVKTYADTLYTPLAHASATSNPHSVTAAQVGALALTGGTMANTNLVTNLNAEYLGGLKSAQYLPKTIYGPTSGNGVLVETDIPAGNGLMVYVTIEGNGYVTGNTIFTTVQFYDTSTSINHAKATNHGDNIPEVKAFNYNSRVYLWLPYQSSSRTYYVTVRRHNYSENRVVSITNAPIPAEGVTKLITITPANSYLDTSLLSKYSLGSNAAISSSDTIHSAFGKAQGQINARALLAGNIGQPFSASKLTSTTLILPQSAPTLTSGEMAIYGLESGFSGELPSGAGSVESVALVSNLTGISVTGSPITTSGTFTLNFVSGYSIPTNIKQGEWDSAYTLRHNAVTLGTANGLSLSTQVLSLGLASASANGALSSTDWNTFNNKQAKLVGTGTSSLVRVNTLGTITYDDNTYLTGNQTITLSGIITGSGTTAITTAIADGALSIAKTNGLQSALDAKMATSSYPDLVAIEALSGTSGFLKKTAANTWSLDTNTYLTTSSAASTYLPLSGGTLTGNVTAPSFQGSIMTPSGVEYLSSLMSNVSAVGWYRVFVSNINNSVGSSVILNVNRSYSSVRNESYIFSINVAYDGAISITQLSGRANSRVITKIRVDYVNVGALAVDIYYNLASTNAVYISGSGNGKFQAPALVAAPTGTTVEFDTVNGVKSDLGFTGNLTGNASTATKLQNSRTIWGQSFDGSGNVTGALSGVTTLSASGIASLTNTTQSTAYTNGGLVLSGGLGIAKDLYSNGKAVFASSVQMLENINTNLRIPKVAPTSPTSGEYYFYIVE